jgi:hypothetical protein
MEYTIQNDADLFWTGLAADGRQVILGYLMPNIVVYWFDSEGNYSGKERISLANKPVRDEITGIYEVTSGFLMRADEELLAYKQEIGYQPCAVQVRAFFDEDEYVGIMRVPSSYQAFLESDEEYSEEEKEAYARHIQRWIEDGQFVFCWCEEYWMDESGEIESS